MRERHFRTDGNIKKLRVSNACELHENRGNTSFQNSPRILRLFSVEDDTGSSVDRFCRNFRQVPLRQLLSVTV